MSAYVSFCFSTEINIVLKRCTVYEVDQELGGGEKTASNNSLPPGPEGLDFSKGLPRGVVTGQIEPCIKPISHETRNR